MEKLIALFKRKYRVIKIENMYFVQVKSGVLPWQNKYISTNEDRAMYAFRLLTGTREVIAEVV